jgi:hypothetical protein
MKKGTNETSLEALKSMGIYPYPTVEEMRQTNLQREWFVVKPISVEDINEDFSNIEDLKWLQHIAKRKKVFLFGESHYFRYIHCLRNRILFALNKFDHYHLLTLEEEFSHTPFYDYYIGIKDDEEAKKFFQEALSDFVRTEEDRELLEHLRRWNISHPNKRIHFACHDIEHNSKSTISKIVIPYFQVLDPSFNIELENFSYQDLRNLIPELKRKLREAKKKMIVGRYPFITPQYIECVIENLQSEAWAFSDFYNQAFPYYRQKAIVRNLTDQRFLGKFFQEGKVMISAGSFHTPSRFPMPEGGNFLRAGSFLSYDFPPTKGKTFSLLVDALAYNMAPVADLDLNKCHPQGGRYISCVTRFQEAYKKGLISKEGLYIFDIRIDNFDKILLLIAQDYPNSFLLVRKIKWEKIIEKVKDTPIYLDIKNRKNDLDMFDSFIFLPGSPIVKARLREG